MKKLWIKHNKIIVAVFALLFVIVDQLIKLVVVQNMQLNESIPLINNVLHLTYVLNDGAAFSFLSGQAWILCGLTSIFLVVLIVAYFHKKVCNPLLVSSFGLIISGGIGNLIDRFFRGTELFYGKVVDYIDFRIINFAVFNFADCCVCVGAALMILYVIIYDKQNPKPQEVSADE